MKGSIGTATYLSYTRPYWGKSIAKLNYIDKLSPEAKVRYKAINLYSSGDYSLGQICEIFEINRSTFYRWRKKYKPSRVESLEDRSRRPQRVRTKVVRNHQVEMQVCQIRRKYPYFGKEKIKRILERDCHINISVSSVGRILTQYRSILPKVKIQTKRIRTLKKKRTRLAQVKKDMKGIISEWIQIDTIELNLRFTKIFLFSAVDPLSRLYYLRAYQRATSFNARDFLLRLTYLHQDRIKYLQIDNGSEWEKHFAKEVEKRRMTLVYNYPKSPKMNAFVERVNGTVQSEYLDRFYEETSVSKINEILYDCLIEYNFYRPHRSLNLLTPIEYCSKLLNSKDPSMVQMYWTQTLSLKIF
jgi:transposase InsO family protein